MRTREVKADFKLAFVGVLVEFSCTHAITILMYSAIRELSEHEIFRMYVGRVVYNTPIIYRISSYKTLPQIIPAFPIMPARGIHLFRLNLVISNNTRS